MTNVLMLLVVAAGVFAAISARAFLPELREIVALLRRIDAALEVQAKRPATVAAPAPPYAAPTPDTGVVRVLRKCDGEEIHHGFVRQHSETWHRLVAGGAVKREDGSLVID